MLHLILMNAKESKFYTLLRKYLTGHHVRIENTIGRGTPDIYWCSKFVTLKPFTCWIEVKVFENNVVKIRPEQMAWMTRECYYGGRCFIIARHCEQDYIAVWDFSTTAFEFRKPYHKPVTKPLFTVKSSSMIKPELEKRYG